jgi:hypothetical protein
LYLSRLRAEGRALLFRMERGNFRI